MEGWKFRIFFSGLTAYVLAPDLSRARVLLVNALNQEPGDKHVPELRFETTYQKQSPWGIPAPDCSEICKDPNLPDGRIWELKNRDLHFLPAPGVTLTDPFRVIHDDLPPNPAQIPKPTDQKFFGWVPTLEMICRKASRINPACLKDPLPTRLRHLVVVRAAIKHGTLQTTELARNKKGKLINWRFAPKGNPNKPIDHQQVCAIEVSCEFSVPSGALTLVGMPFQGGQGSGIAFNPGSGRTVSVHLENRPVEGEKSLRTKGREMDKHFSLYYNLSQQCLPEAQRILPLGRLASRLVSGNCLQERFADDPES